MIHPGLDTTSLVSIMADTTDTVMGTSLLFFSLVVMLICPTAAPASDYEGNLKQLAEAITAQAFQAKRERLAMLDFTDEHGAVTPAGQFLAAELGTQIQVAGEVAVVDPRLVRSTLKKFHVLELAPSEAKAVRRAAKAMRADVLLTGSYVEASEGLSITVTLTNPSNLKAIGEVHGTLPTGGPLAELLKGPVAPTAIEGPKEAPLPGRFGRHRTELYELTVQSLIRTGESVRLEAAIENRSPHRVKVLCHLQDTVLKDDHGAAWTQAPEDDPEGLCQRGLDIAAGDIRHAVLTFHGPVGTEPTEFTLYFHERSPGRDTRFTIERLTADSRAAILPLNQ
jgi:hypothetical protein